MNTTYRDLPIEQLAVHPKNVRRDVGIVTDLANSISAKGIISPLTVAPFLDDANKYTIIAGHRRHAAAQLANLDVLPCVIRADLNTEPKQLEAMLVENTQRTDLTIMEEAQAYQALLEFPGYTVKSVAKDTGRSQTLVRSRLALTKLPTEAQSMVDAGKLTLEQSAVFDEFKDQPDADKTLVHAAANNQWSYEVNRLRRQRDKPINEEASLKVIADLKAGTIKAHETYTGKYNRDYTNTLTAPEHVAAGHVACIDDHSGLIHWYAKDTARNKPKKVLTEEEVAAKKKLKDLEAGLEQEIAIWDEHLRKCLTEAGGGMPLTEEERKIAAGLAANILSHHGHYERAADLLQTKAAGTNDADATREAVAKLRPLQQVMLMVELHARPEALHRPSTWDPTSFNWKYSDHTGTWIELRRDVFGYEPGTFETEAMEHFRNIAAAAASPTTTDDEDGAEDA